MRTGHGNPRSLWLQDFFDLKHHAAVLCEGQEIAPELAMALGYALGQIRLQPPDIQAAWVAAAINAHDKNIVRIAIMLFAREHTLRDSL